MSREWPASSDPRALGGGIVGPGDPHEHGGVVVDTRRAVLLDAVMVSTVDDSGDAVRAAVQIEGRVNRSHDRVSLLILADAEGLAVLTSQLFGLVTRAATVAPGAARESPGPHRGPPVRRVALRRRSPLRAGAPLTRRAGLARQSAKARRLARERRVNLLAVYGDEPACVVRWDAECRLLAEDGHEPRMRSRGADITDPAEVVVCCRHCHNAIHAWPVEATRRGWLVPS